MIGWGKIYSPGAAKLIVCMTDEKEVQLLADAPAGVFATDST